MIRHSLARFSRFVTLAALAGVIASAVPALAADPTPAELERARTYISTKMSAEQRALLERLAKAEGKLPEAFLIGLVGSATLGEKSPEPGEPGSGSGNSGSSGSSGGTGSGSSETGDKKTK